MKTRYFIRLSFKGTHFRGWQIQPGHPTVQSCLDHDMSIIIGERIETTGAGRTDTGVHARIFYAHFDADQDRLDTDDKLVYRINGKLPRDIAVHRIIKVIPDAHARFSALTRTYEYYITRLKDPFLQEYALSLYGNIDTGLITEATEILTEYKDFRSFCRTGTNAKSFICKISHASWKFSEQQMIFTITADRFLRNMVRAIVGTLIDAGFGKISLDGFRQLIESRNRSLAGASAPAKGLFLMDIRYPPEIFLTRL